jgi:hypothetical protein
MFQGNFQFFWEMNRMRENQNQVKKMLQMNMRLHYVNQTYFKYFQQISSEMSQFKEEVTNFTTSGSGLGSTVNIFSKFEEKNKNNFLTKNCSNNNCNTNSNCNSSSSENPSNSSQGIFQNSINNMSTINSLQSKLTENLNQSQNSFLSLKKKRFLKENSKCPHLDAKHYAKVKLLKIL